MVDSLCGMTGWHPAILVQTHNSRWRARCTSSSSYTQVAAESYSNFRKIRSRCVDVYSYLLRLFGLCGKSAEKEGAGGNGPVVMLHGLHVRGADSLYSYSMDNGVWQTLGCIKSTQTGY